MGSSSNLQRIYFFVVFFAWAAIAHSSPAGFYNVLDFGAVPDGKKDNAKAFESAWEQACSWKGKSRLLIPRGTFLSGPVELNGPCNGAVTFQLQGVVKAPSDLSSSDSWFTFSRIDGMTVAGGGAFDGQGAHAWANNKCSKDPNCKLTISIRFNYVTNSKVRNIASIDSKSFHINVLECKNLKFQSVRVSAPTNSINTDGIHIGRSNGISISHSVIGTGDDCVSLGPGSNDISVVDVQCGPGHGISIGSLGKYKDEEPVTGIVVRNCTLTGTDNGIRIKTWPSSPNKGIANNFTFDDIVMNNVNNPILIDQEYCPYSSCNLKTPSQIQISKVKFRNIRGTSASPLAVKLLCSKGFPCKEVELSDINLKYSGNGVTESTCSNVKPLLSGKIFPPACSQSS